MARQPRSAQKGRSRDPLLMSRMLMGVYWFDEALQDALKRAGWPPVTRTQSLLFANLSSGVQRPAELASNLGVSRQYMSQMLSELSARGIVEVTPDPKDGRAQIVSFGREAIPLRDAAFSILRTLEDELRRRIGEPAFEALKAGVVTDWGPPPAVGSVSQS